MLPGTSHGDEAGRRCLRAGAGGLLVQVGAAPGENGLEKLSGERFGDGYDLLRSSGRNDLAAFIAAFGAEVDDPVRAFDDFQVVLDDDDAVAFLNEAVEDFDEKRDIVEVQACRRLVEDQERLLAGLADEVVDELEALGFAAGEGVDRLAEAEVVEAHLAEKFQWGSDFFLGIERFKKCDRLGGGHFQNLVDRFSADLDFEKGRAETGSIAFRTAQEEVAEELHFHLFKAESAAAVAAAIAGVEGKAGGCESGRLGCRGVGKEIADVFVNAKVNGWGGARSFRKWRLVHHDDFVHLLVTADGFHKACGLILCGVLADELPVEDVTHERGFS